MNVSPTATVHLILIWGCFIRVRDAQIRIMEHVSWLISTYCCHLPGSIQKIFSKFYSISNFQIRIPLSLHADMSVADTMTNTGTGIPISVSVMTSLGGGSGKKSSSKKDSACIVVPANLLDVPD